MRADGAGLLKTRDTCAYVLRSLIAELPRRSSGPPSRVRMFRRTTKGTRQESKHKGHMRGFLYVRGR